MKLADRKTSYVEHHQSRNTDHHSRLAEAIASSPSLFAFSGRLNRAGRSPCCRAGSAASSASVHSFPAYF